MSQEEDEHTPSIQNEVQLFANQIESLRQALPMTMMLLQMFDKDAVTKLKAFEEQYCVVEVEESTRQVQIPYEYYSKWNKLKHRYDRGHIARDLVPRSLFVSLVSQYDAFLGRILRLLFLAKPEMLNTSKREIAFSELVEFPSIEAAREYVISKEIESVLRMSHAEQLKWMENRFGITLTKFENLPNFVEIAQRRNIFVHMDGLISKQYISECRDCSVALDAKMKEGEPLGVPQRYFDESCTCILEVGVKLAHVLWIKLIPSQLQNAEESLIELTYDLIDRREYPLAIALLKFAAVEIRKHSNESRRLTLVVNLAQAYAWHGDIDKCKQILDAEDWSAKGDEFKLAEAVLREDWERSVRLVERMGKKGAVSEVAYQDWPLFQVFRSRPEFLEAYQKVFEKPFPVSVESKSSDINGQADREAQTNKENRDSGIMDESPLLLSPSK
jgi:hypothetical protein